MSESFIRHAGQAGVYHLPADRRAPLESSAGEADLACMAVAIPRKASLAGLLKDIGNALNFPDWYGANLDALYDCLTDPEALPGRGRVLFLTGTSRLLRSDPEGYATLIEVFQAAASDLARQGSPFWVILDSPADGIPELPTA